LQSENPGLEVVHPSAAGIDVGNGFTTCRCTRTVTRSTVLTARHRNPKELFATAYRTLIGPRN
jgi:hypothetical protein